MAESEENLLDLQELQEDIIELEHGQLQNIDRLRAILEAHITEFRQLLSKPAKNDTSRKALQSGIGPSMQSCFYSD